jgi:RNA polymerase II C-terminal domain phosphatase-like 3/4
VTRRLPGRIGGWEEDAAAWSHTRVTVTPTDGERLVGLMEREQPRSAVVAGGGADGDSSGSLQEISADDFRKESSAGAGGGGALGCSAARSRSWVAPHMGYMSRSYAPAFHSFAWAQAVQKKPLVPATDDKDEVDHAVDVSDEEMEEGEIEEGEAAESSPPPDQPKMIDLDLDMPAEKSEPVAVEGSGNTATAGEDDVDFDQRVGSILEELEMVSIEEAEKYGHTFLSQWSCVWQTKSLIWTLRNYLNPVLLCCRSFEGACTRLRTCFESLKLLFPEDGSPMPMLEPLVQQAFVAIDTITTVRPLCFAGFPWPNRCLTLVVLFL